MLTRIDAVSKFAWITQCCIALLFMRTPHASALFFLLLLSLIAVSPRDVGAARLAKSLPLVLLVPTALFAFHAVSFNGLRPTIAAAGAHDGLVAGLRVAFVVLASLTFLWTTDLRQLMVGLVRLRVPYRWAFALYLALRYVPLLQRHREIIKDAIAIRQQSRRPPLSWALRLWLRYLFLLVVNGLRSAEQSAVALQLRGLESEPPQHFLTEYRLTWYGPLLLVFTVGVAVFARLRFG